MRKTSLIVAGCSLLLLSACSRLGIGGGAESSSSSSQSEQVTQNVTYQGTVEDTGVTVYQQGTHKLTLENGSFILLESSSIDLDAYLGRRVEVRGSTSPTVEAGGTIMVVAEVTDLDASSSSASAKMCGGIAGIACDAGMNCIDDPSDSCDPNQGGADCGGICVPSSVSSTSSVAAASSSVQAASSSQAPVSSAPPASSAMSVSSSSVVSTDLEAKIVVMMKEDFTNAARWTQTYCSQHMGFCLPVHKNWYYKSYGAKAGSLWRVEFDNAELPDTPDSGVIKLNVLSGTSASAGGSSGQISVNGSVAIGYFDFDDKHFEISGDTRLRAAIEYMISHITAQQSS